MDIWYYVMVFLLTLSAELCPFELKLFAEAATASLHVHLVLLYLPSFYIIN